MGCADSGAGCLGESVRFTSKDDNARFRPLALKVLAASRWFAEFPPPAVERIVDAGRIARLARGDVLNRRGEIVTELVIVLDGSLDVSVTSPEGRRLIQVVLEAGQVMNLIPALDGQPTIHDACAHADLVLLLANRDALLAESDRDPRVSRALMRILCLRSRVLYASLLEATFLTLRVRCARVLHSLMSQYGVRRDEGIEIALKLSQEELADMIGRSRQSVNKELKALEREGVLRMAYSHFIVVDEMALTEIALSEGSPGLPTRL